MPASSFNTLSGIENRPITTGDYQTNELLRGFSALKIVYYQDVSDEADWDPGRKSRIVRFIAEEPMEKAH